MEVNLGSPALCGYRVKGHTTSAWRASQCQRPRQLGAGHCQHELPSLSDPSYLQFVSISFILFLTFHSFYFTHKLFREEANWLPLSPAFPIITLLFALLPFYPLWLCLLTVERWNLPRRPPFVCVSSDFSLMCLKWPLNVSLKVKFSHVK